MCACDARTSWRLHDTSYTIRTRANRSSRRQPAQTAPRRHSDRRFSTRERGPPPWAERLTPVSTTADLQQVAGPAAHRSTVGCVAHHESAIGRAGLLGSGAARASAHARGRTMEMILILHRQAVRPRLAETYRSHPLCCIGHLSRLARVFRKERGRGHGPTVRVRRTQPGAFDVTATRTRAIVPGARAVKAHEEERASRWDGCPPP